jgi:malate/lactate dehydrogenase
MANTSAPTAQLKKNKTRKSYADLEEQVRNRAYEIYERRGREDGHALEDWLQAQSELPGRSARD